MKFLRGIVVFIISASLRLALEVLCGGAVRIRLADQPVMETAPGLRDTTCLLLAGGANPASFGLVPRRHETYPSAAESGDKHALQRRRVVKCYDVHHTGDLLG